MDIETVIDNFGSLSFNDNDYADLYLRNLINEYSNPKSSHNNIRNIIKDELICLQKIIIKRQEEDFFTAPEIFDYKYNHWFCLHWIIRRHYINELKLPNAREIIPKSHLDLIQLCKVPEGTCYELINRLLMVI